jgi:hypothetical protein
MADEQQQPTQEAPQQEPLHGGPKPATPAAEPKNTDTPSQEQTVPYARFKEVNDRLKALEDDNAKKAKAQAEADEKRMAEQAQWQQLAEKRQAKVDELSTKGELADELTALVLKQYQAEIKDWPETVRAMAPGDDASILVKLEWMNKAKPLALELLKEKTPAAGNGRKPVVTAQAHSQAKQKIEPIYDVRRNF